MKLLKKKNTKTTTPSSKEKKKKDRKGYSNSWNGDELLNVAL